MMAHMPAFICLALSSVLTVHDAFQGVGGGEPATEVWRTARACGATALFLYARTHGLPGVSYSDVLGKLPLGPRGCNCQQLVEAGEALGLEMAVYETDFAGLDLATGPVLLYMGDYSGDAAMGHFVVYLGVDDREDGGGVRSFRVLDTVTAAVGSMELDVFRRKWSGLVIGSRGDLGVPQRNWMPYGVAFFLLAFFCVVGAGAWIRRCRLN